MDSLNLELKNKIELKSTNYNTAHKKLLNLVN
jgi:hypothetical protein